VDSFDRFIEMKQIIIIYGKDAVLCIRIRLGDFGEGQDCIRSDSGPTEGI